MLLPPMRFDAKQGAMVLGPPGTNTAAEQEKMRAWQRENGVLAATRMPPSRKALKAKVQQLRRQDARGVIKGTTSIADVRAGRDAKAAGVRRTRELELDEEQRALETLIEDKDEKIAECELLLAKQRADINLLLARVRELEHQQALNASGEDHLARLESLVAQLGQRAYEPPKVEVVGTIEPAPAAEHHDKHQQHDKHHPKKK